MILYTLCCDNGHEFDVWFRDSAAYDTQVKAGVISCPMCGSAQVSKAVMAPNIARHHGARQSQSETVRGGQDGQDAAVAAVGSETGAAAAGVGEERALAAQTQPEASSATERTAVRARPTPEVAAKMAKALEALREHVEATCDDVGQDFAEEARRIHYGEAEARGIYGDTTQDEAEALRDEGISFATIPWRRRRTNG